MTVSPEDSVAVSPMSRMELSAVSDVAAASDVASDGDEASWGALPSIATETPPYARTRKNAAAAIKLQFLMGEVSYCGSYGY